MTSYSNQKSSPVSHKLSSQQYTYLTIKQLKQQMSTYGINYETHITQTLIPLAKNAKQLTDLQKQPQKRQQIIYEIIKKIKQQDNQYKQFVIKLKLKLKQNVQNLTDNESKKNMFMSDCLRQSMSYPWKKQNKQFLLYNFSNFFKQSLNKQTRRVLWQKMLTNQQNAKLFFHFNHQLTPYNIESEFRITIQRIAEIQKIKLKQAQKDNAIKLLEYTVKKNKKIPNRNQVYLVLTLVDLFSFYQPNKIQQLGTIYCGLEDLSAFYFESKLDTRLSNILKALQLVDEQSYNLLVNYFLKDQTKQLSSKLQMNEIFQHFRLSLGSKFLPLNTSQYLIDQLLIKKKNRFDIYVMFAITMLILGDKIQSLLGIAENNSVIIDDKGGEGEINFNPTQNFIISPKKVQQIDQNSPPKQITFKLIFQKSKQTIKRQDFIQSFNIIYEKVPAIYSQNDIYQMKMNSQQTNKLFDFLLEYERQQMKIAQMNITAEQNKELLQNVQDQQIESNNNQVEGQQQQLLKQLQKWKQKLDQNEDNNMQNFVQKSNKQYRLSNQTNQNNKKY